MALIALAIFAFASTVRLANLGQRSLTHDEAWRANWSHHGGMDEILHFPPLQFALNWVIQHGIGRSEFVVRLPYALAGIVCVIALYEFTRRTFDARSALFVAGVAAVHPALVANSRILKVFGLEGMMSALLLWAGFAAYSRFTRRNLFLFLAAALAGLSLTFTSSLLIAAWAPLLVWAAIRDKAKNDDGLATMRDLLRVGGVIAVCGAAWYWWLSSCPYTEQRFVRHHGAAYHVWLESYAPADMAAWLFSSIYGAMRYCLGIELVWAPLNWVIGTMAMLAVCGSVGVVWQRARVLFAFMAILLFLALVAALLRQWPLAALHTSTFLLPPVVVSMGCGLAVIAARLGRSGALAMILGVCLALPAARAVKATMVAPSYSQHVRPIFEYVSAHKQPGDALFIYYPVSDAFEFYWRDDKTPVLVQPGSDRGQLERFTQRFDGFIVEHGRVWFVFTHNWGTERADYLSFLTGDYRLLDTYEVGNASAHLFACRASPAVGVDPGDDASGPP